MTAPPPQPGRSRRRLLRLVEREGGRCCYCHRPIAAGIDPRYRISGLFVGGVLTFPATVEHVVPRSRGGANTADNRRAACAECNNGKGAAIDPCHPLPLTPRQRRMLGK